MLWSVFNRLLMHLMVWAWKAYNVYTGLAIQIHHASKILVCINEPYFGGVDAYLERFKTVQSWIHTICGVGLTLLDDASSLISSQCVFIGAYDLSSPYSIYLRRRDVAK